MMTEVVDNVCGKPALCLCSLRHCNEGKFWCSNIIKDPSSEISDDEQEVEKENVVVAYLKSQNSSTSNAR
jgi:hypothetical protein